MIVVSDTSAITALLQISRADLFLQLYGEVLIPVAVRDELLATHAQLPPFLQVRTVNDAAEVYRLKRELDLGEAEALALAKQYHADLLLIDELRGRKIAQREGIPFIGLMGVLLQGKQTGRIASVRPVVAELEKVAGFRVSTAVKEIVFRNAGEP